jgi:hypothetical protein
MDYSCLKSLIHSWPLVLHTNKTAGIFSATAQPQLVANDQRKGESVQVMFYFSLKSANDSCKFVVCVSVRKGARDRWYPKISARRAGAMPAAAEEKAPNSRVNRLGRHDRASFFGITAIPAAYCRDAESDGRGHGNGGVEPCHDPWPMWSASHREWLTQV